MEFEFNHQLYLSSQIATPQAKILSVEAVQAARGSFDELHVSTLHANSGDTTYTTLLQVDEKTGNVGVATSGIELKHLHATEAKLGDTTVANLHISATGLNAGTTAQVLSVLEGGEVRIAEGLRVDAGGVLHGATLLQASIEDATSVTTEIMTVQGSSSLKGETKAKTFTAESITVQGASSLLGDTKAKTLAVDSLTVDGSSTLLGDTKAKTLTAGTLTINGQSSLLGEIYVDGSATIRGSVIGSGPYVDSSDARFKLEVRNLESGVLDRITSLRAKTYRYNTEHFPSRGFPNERQVS